MKKNVKFSVYGSNGGLYGVFRDRKSAEACKSRHEKMLRETWKVKTIRVYIEESEDQ